MGGRSLEGRVVVVTGATRGIGREVVRALRGEGATVWAVARNEDQLRELGAETGATPLPCDITDADAVAGLPGLVSPSVPDLLVNAAGVFDVAPLASTSLETFRRNVEVNLVGAFQLLRAFLPEMLSRRNGLIVNVGSVAGRRAFPGNGAYSASKFGLRGMHEVLLEELRGTGVRATLLEPSACDTSIWDALDPDTRDDLPSRDQMLRPSDVAEAVTFLATRPESVQIPLLLIERS